MLWELIISGGIVVGTIHLLCLKTQDKHKRELATITAKDQYPKSQDIVSMTGYRFVEADEYHQPKTQTSTYRQMFGAQEIKNYWNEQL